MEIILTVKIDDPDAVRKKLSRAPVDYIEFLDRNTAIIQLDPNDITKSGIRIDEFLMSLNEDCSNIEECIKGVSVEIENRLDFETQLVGGDYFKELSSEDCDYLVVPRKGDDYFYDLIIDELADAIRNLDYEVEVVESPGSPKKLCIREKEDWDEDTKNVIEDDEPEPYECWDYDDCE